MKRLTSFIFLLIGLIITSNIHAKGLILDRTRIIFPLSANKVSIESYNSNDFPVLSQLWIDDNSPLDPNIMTSTMPIVINPPVIKLKAKEKRFITLFLTTKKNLPTDRESLLFLNSQEITPLDSNQSDGNKLNISVINRIKIFLRPKSLANKDSKEWIKALSCNSNQEKSKLKINCKNPTGFYATIASININHKHTVDGDMISPFSHHEFIIDLAQKDMASVIQLSVIDDNGISHLITPKSL